MDIADLFDTEAVESGEENALSDEEDDEDLESLYLSPPFDTSQYLARLYR